MEDCRDENGNFTVILQDIDISTVRSLSELLYTGTTTVNSADSKTDLMKFLSEDVLVDTVLVGKSIKEEHFTTAFDELDFSMERSVQKRDDIKEELDVITPNQKLMPKNEKNQDVKIKRQKRAKFKESVLSHVSRTENGARCNVCQKDFKHPQSCTAHVIKQHLKDTKYECHHCRKQFSTKANFELHLATVHVPIEQRQRFSCDLCGTDRLSQKGIEYHKKTKHGVGEMPKGMTSNSILLLFLLADFPQQRKLYTCSLLYFLVIFGSLKLAFFAKDPSQRSRVTR